MAEAAVAAAAIVEIVATAGIAATAGNAPGNTFLQRVAARGRFLDCVFRAIAIGLPVPGPSRLVCHGPVNGSQLSPQ